MRIVEDLNNNIFIATRGKARRKIVREVPAEDTQPRLPPDVAEEL